MKERRFYGPPAATKRRVRVRRAMVLAGAGLWLIGPGPALASQSDFNHDGEVDLADLIYFAEHVLNVNWETYDWCEWAAEEDGRLQDKHDELVDFIIEYYECNAPPEPPFNPLAVEHELRYPTRLTWGTDGRLYVSDAKVKSVFIYETGVDGVGQTVLNLIGELKNAGRIVAVGVDAGGLIYVGNTQHRRIDTYNQQAEFVGSIGAGTIRMPTDLAFDADWNLYVADSESHVVWVFKRDGTLLRSIRRGGLNTPMAVEVAYVDDGSGNQVGELYVGDKGNYLVKVYDLQGSLLRSFGGFVEKEGWFNPTWIWQGMFVSLQSLAVDQGGNVHALDSFMNNGQILNPTSGEYITHYGETGSAPGQMLLPLDVDVNDAGLVALANADNRRVEIIYEVP